MKSLARLFRFDGYETKDVSYSSRDLTVTIHLTRQETKEFKCCRCGTHLGRKRGQYVMKIQELSIMGCKTFIFFWRVKGECPKCKKARSEEVSFLSEETPHLSKSYAEWIGTMCEFAAVSRVAGFCKQGNMTVRRVDFSRMKRLLKDYKIPPVRNIAVDEVYARKKSRYKDEEQSKKYFTVITDLNTKRVIWVSEGRSKEALDQFYILLGEKACEKIEVVAMDQFDGYAASTMDYCKKAKIVWDKFHIMKNFEEAVNETRKDLHENISSKDPLFPLTMGRYRFLFLKKANRRTAEEKTHIDQVFLENSDFLKLEVIKEKMMVFFDQITADEAKDVLDEVTVWIWQAGFRPLMKWVDNLHKGWETLKNYFSFKVTSAIAEGMNNVIKSLKRRAFGFRNMDYFRLKIMQVCGYLNSKWVNSAPVGTL